MDDEGFLLSHSVCGAFSILFLNARLTFDSVSKLPVSYLAGCSLRKQNRLGFLDG